MGDRSRRSGKELASGYTSGGPGDDAYLGSAPIVIVDQQGCMLTIEDKIPDSPMWRARCNGRPCSAISKKTDEAFNMYNTLIMCEHPNILEPIGVWLDPSDNNKAYVAVNPLDIALSSLETDWLFDVEGTNLNGFSELGFRVFREIFSAIAYVNTNYKGEATSSANNNQIELFPMMLEPRNIFLRYDELLWKQGIWDVDTKMHFIREVFWLLDDQRNIKDPKRDTFAKTERGKKLMKQKALGLLPLMTQFSPPKDHNDQELAIKDDNMLHSFLFLRNKIVAHFDEEYIMFKGNKDDIGTSKFTRERYVRKSKPDYMIKLAKAIRALGWIQESPVTRGETDYMATFSKMRVQE
ncbi:hypothetical protein EJB05_27722 [Eragrostis curvula]|uniref:Uncharacterized protein n=1 Tax=Eragrostis curvula TaxID=38414 RepID=A0A5J9UNA2_9POAL|nr:hypothetical protein EJB05_27722 [Eragrostis curvula]